MEWGTVSIARLIGMLFTFIVSVGLPILVAVILRRKMKAKTSAFFVGCGIFIGFALISEQIMHTLVLIFLGEILLSNVVLYGLYGGLAAALFEETGRYFAMRLGRKTWNEADMLMYGVGHGGAEAIIVVGIGSISNFISSIMINNGSIQKTFSVIDPTLQEVTFDQLSALWQTPAIEFYLGGIERILALLLQICLSVLVYQSVKTGRKLDFAKAFFLHAAVNFLIVVSASVIPAWAVELELLVVVLAIAKYVSKTYHVDTV